MIGIEQQQLAGRERAATLPRGQRAADPVADQGDGNRTPIDADRRADPANALPRLGREPFLLVNSDIYTDFDFRILVEGPHVPTLVLVPNPPHNARGDFGLDSGGFVSASAPLSTYAGVAIFDPKMFAGLTPGRRPLKPLLDAAIARRELKGLAYSGLWLDVGTPERLEEARALAAKS